MELETEDQINIDYNRFFYATVCHVCKQFSAALWRCDGCKMISYCGEEHRKQNWAQHEPLCKIIQNMLRDGLEGTPPDDWYSRKLSLIEAVEKKKGFLEGYEMEMFLFPRECAVCHEEDLESLVVCRKCAISFCKDKHDIAHRDACGTLELCFRSSLSAMKKQNLDQYFEPRHMNWILYNSGTKTYNFQDMADFVHTFWNKENIEEAHLELYTILEANVSEYLTHPLTLFCAMQSLNYAPERKELVIHVVDAGVGETITRNAWEFFLHMKDNELSLLIIMIGTKLKFKSHSLSVCDSCLSQGKKISFEFHSVLYGKYVCSPSFVKPDLIVGFNVGVGFNIPGKNEFRYVTEMTELCIQLIAIQNCPFLVTFRKQEELETYKNYLNAILKRTVDYIYSGKNPFASLRPFRWPGKLIIYNNNFMVIYRSLFS